MNPPRATHRKPVSSDAGFAQMTQRGVGEIGIKYNAIDEEERNLVYRKLLVFNRKQWIIKFQVLTTKRSRKAEGWYEVNDGLTVSQMYARADCWLVNKKKNREALGKKERKKDSLKETHDYLGVSTVLCFIYGKCTIQGHVNLNRLKYS